jgi:hypothetical protein
VVTLGDREVVAGLSRFTDHGSRCPGRGRGPPCLFSHDLVQEPGPSRVRPAPGTRGGRFYRTNPKPRQTLALSPKRAFPDGGGMAGIGANPMGLVDGDPPEVACRQSDNAPLPCSRCDPHL